METSSKQTNPEIIQPVIIETRFLHWLIETMKTSSNQINPKVIQLIEKARLERWEALWLGNIQITAIPESIAELTSLAFLELGNNQLTAIPECIANLTRLNYLDLKNNQITAIPECIANLTKLKYLDLSNNQLTSIPESITNVTSLTRLDLRNNQLTTIPESITKLTNLTSLDLSNNQLTTIPENLLKLNLPILLNRNYERSISFENNPLVDPPIFIVNRGREALEDYFRRKKLAEVFPLNEIKVILVGKSEAGKTSLLKRICGEPFDKNESQTHGINIRHIDCPTPEKKLKLHIWDFGGQEIMHATHQFFLTKNSIYVLVLNSRQEEDTDYWLKYIETFGGNSPILVVMNKCDEHRGFDVDRRTWKEKYKGIKDFYKVSCATDEGIETFTNGLKEWILESHFMNVTWFKEWLSVRDELNDTTDDYINDKEYRKVCQKFTITEESEQTTLLNYMHDLGTFIHFDKVALNDTFVLNPNWVTNAVYSIINSKQLANSHGKLNFNKDLGAILDTEPDFVLIPSLLNPNRPAYEFDAKYSLTFEFRYTFLPFSLFSRFMVRMNKDIDVKWRYGVLLKNKDYDVEALVISDKEERKITIRVNGTRRREYFAILWNHFDTIHKSFPPSFEYNQYIPVPGHEEYTIDYMELIGREANGETRYYVAKLNKYVSIKDLLDGIEDPKTRMEKNKELYKQPDTTIHVYGDYIKGDKDMGDTYNLNSKDGILNNVNVGRGTQNVTGNSTVNVNQEKEKPELQEVLKVLTELKEMLQKLNLPENQKTKAKNALDEIEQDTKTETPDAESVGENIQKAVKIIEKSELAVEHTTGFVEKMGDLVVKLGVAFPSLANLINNIG